MCVTPALCIPRHLQVLLEFLETFEQGGGGTVGDGVVTLEEFMAYYS